MNSGSEVGAVGWQLTSKRGCLAEMRWDEMGWSPCSGRNGPWQIRGRPRASGAKRKHEYLESPWPLKNGVITQNNGVVDPFLKGHGETVAVGTHGMGAGPGLLHCGSSGGKKNRLGRITRNGKSIQQSRTWSRNDP